MDIVELFKGASDDGQLATVVLTILIIVGIIHLGAKLWKTVAVPFMENRYKKQETIEEKDHLIASHTDEILKLRDTIIELQTDTNNRIEQMQADNTKQIKMLVISIQALKDCNEQQTTVMREQIKHSIVRACQDHVNRKIIKASEISAILKLYFLYSGEPINGNTFVYDNVKLVVFLPIIRDGAENYNLMEDIHRFLESHDELALKSQIRFIDGEPKKGFLVDKEGLCNELF